MRRLDHQRITNPRRLARQHLRRLVLARIPRHHRHPGRRHQVLRTRLAAHPPHRRRRRPDEHQPRRSDRIGEVRVLRQEPVPRMDRLRARAQRHRDDRVPAQVRLLRRRPADRIRLVRQPHMLRIGIRRREHRNRGNPHPPASANDPAGDLPAIGYQYLLEHHFLATDFTDEHRWASEYAAVDLGAWTEVQEQSQADASRLKVVEDLCIVCGHEVIYGLDLYYQLALDNEVGAKHTYHLVAEPDFDWRLSFPLQAFEIHFQSQCVFIYRLKKTMSELVVGTVERANHALAQLRTRSIRETRIHAICSYQCSSVANNRL